MTTNLWQKRRRNKYIFEVDHGNWRRTAASRFLHPVACSISNVRDDLFSTVHRSEFISYAGERIMISNRYRYILIVAYAVPQKNISCWILRAYITDIYWLFISTFHFVKHDIMCKYVHNYNKKYNIRNREYIKKFDIIISLIIID